MSRHGGTRGEPARRDSTRKNTSLLAAVLMGMVLGLLIAGGIAWYILKMPSPFTNTASHEQVALVPDAAKPPPPAAKPAEAAAAASGVDDGKPRFEFYKVLTDKTEATTLVPAAPAAKSAGKPESKETLYLQAGAFTNADEAERVKAKLALLGLEATVQSAELPDKTVWHRVRLGPYKSEEERGRVAAMLKQNGVTATPMRTQ